MKYITIILMSVLSSILCSISLFAQTGSGSVGQLEGYDFSTFTINGLEVIYTRGKPRFLIEKSVQVIITYKLHYPVILVP